LVFVACGKVTEVPNAMQADAALDAFSCAAPMLACAAACVDPMTDTKNCGGCGISCESGVETCSAGVCVDTTMTCANVAAGNPTASDGQYTLINGTVLNCDFSDRTCGQMFGSNASLANGTYTKTDGTTIDCDMEDGGLQVIGVAWGQFNVVTAGYKQISLAAFQNTILQQFFLKYYNSQLGATLIAQWEWTNCCFIYDTGSDTIDFGAGVFVYPMTPAGVQQCTPSATLGPLEAFALNGGTTAELPPLGSDFFTLNPPATGTCSSVGNNPSFFWKVMP
jgi:hypothetical protein